MRKTYIKPAFTYVELHTEDMICMSVTVEEIEIGRDDVGMSNPIEDEEYDEDLKGYIKSFRNQVLY